MVEICGVQYKKGVGKKSGKPYEGYTIYFTEDGKPWGVEGYTTGDAFISLEVLQGQIPRVGDRVELFYNKNGFLQRISFVA